MDHYASYTGVQYSPLDMAEYVFWTGDERGVTTAIEDFLQEGLVRIHLRSVTSVGVISLGIDIKLGL